MNQLSKEEQTLLHNVEVLGMSPSAAGRLLGMSNASSVLTRPHVAAAREDLKKAVQARVAVTKEDIIEGIQEAIDVARSVADPSSMIRGYESIAKLLGYDKSAQVNININGMTLAQARRALRGVSDTELAQIARQEDVIDADFYEVNK